MWRLSSTRSGTPPTAVASVSRSLVGSESPAVATVAALTTPPSAPAPTLTSRVKPALSPAAIGAACVAVTMPAAATTLQPPPAALAKVRPAGSVSVTVVAKGVAVEPRFVTTSV